MNPPRLRRLAFELLEPKSSPSALLLALAPLDELDQRVIESDRAMYATSTNVPNDGSAALLKFIERNTRGDEKAGSTMSLPTREQVAATDKMMQTTDTDLRTTLITELAEASSVDCDNVFSVIQF
ncbi:MAG TPA: hypothetical protein QF564_24930 [Pirellulaceae bacterium]|jgi:hypothetical protein|nr:hypothetical protein [Pirellulaceae bacterium]